MPVVNATALYRFVNPIRAAGDAMNEDCTSHEGSKAAGANGFIDSWHRLPLVRGRDLQPNARGVGSAFAQERGGKAVLFVEQAKEKVLGSDVPVGEPLGFVGRVFQDALSGAAQRKIDVGWGRRARF